MMGRPLSRPLRSSGWTMSSFCPFREASFIVQTTLPMTHPSSTLFLSRGGEFGLVQRVELHFIDNTDNRGIHRPVFALGGHARAAAGHDQYGLANSRINHVHGDQVAGFVGAFGGNRFDDQEFLAFETRVFTRRNHGADNACQNHAVPITLKSEISTNVFAKIDATFRSAFGLRQRYRKPPRHDTACCGLGAPAQSIAVCSARQRQPSSRWEARPRETDAAAG